MNLVIEMPLILVSGKQKKQLIEHSPKDWLWHRERTVPEELSVYADWKTGNSNH